MKKSLKFILCTITVLSLFFIFASAEASALTYGDFEYSVLKDGTVQIDKCNRGFEVEEHLSTDPEDVFYIMVPSEIEGKEVTSIGKKAFEGVGFVKGVVIPSSVKKIKDYAFANSDFGEIKLNEGLESIGKYAFYNSQIGSISIPSTVKTIGAYSFGYYKNEKGKPTLSKNVMYCYENSAPEKYAVKNKISYKYFNGDYKYSILKDGTVQIDGYNGTETKLTVPKKISGKKVTSIGKYAFAYNKTLTQVTIPGTIKTINGAAFYYVNSLKKVTIKDGVTTIKNKAFYDCRYLATVTMSDSVTKLGDYVFASCPKLSKITFSKNLASIGSNVVDNTKFYKNKDNWENNILYVHTYILDADVNNIKGKVNIKDGTTLIADGAFSCSSKSYDNITSVTIPKSVKVIGNDAFSECRSLSKLTLKNGIQTIGKRAFYNADLKSVTIPKSVKTIGEKAFGYGTNLKGREVKLTDFTIVGYKNTKAQTYAKNNGFEFKAK